ncbi:hypothetical protein [Mitsuokella multacida]|jgi:DNA-binding transcriptional MerR regulator|uniref:hypothetical protein n=1 Tax=Mitsuokella multacida TaxID=52226 RepID=UPI003FA3420E
MTTENMTPNQNAEGSQTPGQMVEGGKGFSQEDFDRRWARQMTKLEKELGMPISEAKAQIQKFQEFQNSQKSEIQKLMEEKSLFEKRALETEMELAAIKADVLRARLAREMGLSSEWIEDIKGISEDEIRASITSIKKRHGLDRAGGPTPPGASNTGNTAFNQFVLERAGRSGR